MPGFIDRDAVQAMLGRAQLVEVLEPGSYRQIPLPGALNIPLHELDHRSLRELRNDAPVVTPS